MFLRVSSLPWFHASTVFPVKLAYLYSKIASGRWESCRVGIRVPRFVVLVFREWLMFTWNLALMWKPGHLEVNPQVLPIDVRWKLWKWNVWCNLPYWVSSVVRSGTSRFFVFLLGVYWVEITHPMERHSKFIRNDEMVYIKAEYLPGNSKCHKFWLILTSSKRNAVVTKYPFHPFSHVVDVVWDQKNASPISVGPMSQLWTLYQDPPWFGKLVCESCLDLSYHNMTWHYYYCFSFISWNSHCAWHIGSNYIS